MLKKSERLNRAAFSQYFAKGKRNHGTYTTIITSPAETFFASVVVGKKVFKLAHQRNSLRRRVYALVERYKKERNLTGVFIIITKPEAAKLSKKEFTLAFKTELGRVLN